MTARKNHTHPLFCDVRDFIRRHFYLDDESLDVVTVWVFHTWFFSGFCHHPHATPYLYLTGGKGSGKTLLGIDIFSVLCRHHESTAGVTGPGLFRLIGAAEASEDDDDIADIAVTTYPTMAIDEVDALFSGAKDEGLRLVANVGYKRGSTIPRVVGKRVIPYNAFSPKALMGIDNGHLPETILDRSIRIDIQRATPEQMKTVAPWYSFDIEDEAAELAERLSAFARDHALLMREYRPDPPIEGLSPRQWEIARTLVMVGHGLGMESRIRDSIGNVMARMPARTDGRVEMYQAISDLFEELGTDRVTTNQILAKLQSLGLRVPGGSGKGLAKSLEADGVTPNPIRFRSDHPLVLSGVIPADKLVQRGYWLSKFDEPFMRYISDSEDDAE